MPALFARGSSLSSPLVYSAVTTFDLITLGRVGLDLFSEQVCAAFEQVESFGTSVGGSPTNVAIAGSRLSLKTAVLTGVGEDKVADFVRAYLEREKVDTRFVLTKPAGRTGLAVVGVQPPEHFPLTFYRENPADVLIGIDDVLNLPIAEARALLISGTALAQAPCRDATLFAAERANSAGVPVFLDLDLRPDQWHDPRAYGVNLRALLPLVDTVIGTEEESFAALLENPNDASSTVIQVLNQEQKGDLEDYLPQYLESTARPTTWLLKRGAEGVSIFEGGGESTAVLGFEADVVNTVGAGDAFAGGLVYGFLQGWGWDESARFANACGAIVVSRHGCASAMPTLEEVEAVLA